MLGSSDYVAFKDQFNFEAHTVLKRMDSFRGNSDGTCTAQSLRWIALQQDPSLEKNKGGALMESLIDTDDRIIINHIDVLGEGNNDELSKRADKTVFVQNDIKSAKDLADYFSGLSSYVLFRFYRVDWSVGHVIGVYNWYFGSAKIFDPNHGEYTIIKKKNLYDVLFSFIESKYGKIGSLVYVTHLFSYKNPAKVYKDLKNV